MSWSLIPDEAATVCWIFERCLSGDSLGKIAAGLEEQGISSPTGKPKRNREALNKLLSNEKYMGRVLLQKTISVGSSKFKNDGFMDRYLYSDSHEAIISDEMFKAAQQKTAASKMPRQNICHAGVFLIKYKFRMAKWVNAIPSGNKNKRRGKRLCVAAYCRVSTTFEEQRGSLKVQQQFYTSMIDMRPDWINAGIFFRPCNRPEYCGTPWPERHATAVPQRENQQARA